MNNSSSPEEQKFLQERDALSRDHARSVENYILHLGEVQKIEKILFQLKLGLGSLIVAVFIFIFSSENAATTFSAVFRANFIVLLFVVIALVSDEVWRSYMKMMANFVSSSRDTLLTNVRSNALLRKGDRNYDNFRKLGAVAESLYNENVGVLADMKSGMSVEQILQKRTPTQPKWPPSLMLWIAISACVPILFTYELFLSNW